MPEATEQKPAPRVNLRTPDVMAAVQAQVETHYRSEIVEHLRTAGGVLSVDGLTVRLAKQFGFCLFLSGLALFAGHGEIRHSYQHSSHDGSIDNRGDESTGLMRSQ